MKFNFKDRTFEIKRYPPTTNRSLQPWNASDELILDYISKIRVESNSLALINDRFGFLATTLFKAKPLSIVNHRSHKKAIEKNYTSNSLVLKPNMFKTPFEHLSHIDIGVIKVPKSLATFELYIQLLHRLLPEHGAVICGFMTKYFTPQLLEISRKYFYDVEQSKAKKKARLLILRSKKVIEHQIVTEFIKYNGQSYQQYPGVFSSGHIDYATQFLLKHFKVHPNESIILDMASGNGVIAVNTLAQNPDAEVHLLDDSFLAIESSKLNINKRAHFHWNDSLEDFKDGSLDLVVSNPPFHFEFETNIEVTLELFRQVYRCLKESGRFVLVANRHLNYKTHLDKVFKRCSVTKENDKFVVYECIK